MPKFLKELRIVAVDFVDSGANPLAHITLMKRDMTMPEGTGITAEDAARLEKIEADLAQVADGVVSAEDRGFIAKLRGLFTKPEVAVVEPPMTEELAKRDATIAALQADIAKRADDAAKAEYITKAAGLKVFGVADDLGSVLHKISKALTPDEFTAFETKLRAVQAQVEASQLLKEFGVDGGDEVSPEDKLDRMARDRVAKGGDITFAQAYAEVCNTDEGKILYAQRGGK